MKKVTLTDGRVLSNVIVKKLKETYLVKISNEENEGWVSFDKEEINSIEDFPVPKAQEDYKELVEMVSKYQELEKAWYENQKEDTIFFLRKCKEIFEGAEIPKRTKRT